MIERISNPQVQQEDSQLLSLRPKFLENFIGQEMIKSNMKVYIKAALERNEPIDHILLSGPPGLGKTTLASIIAKEMKTNIRLSSAPIIEKTGDMASLLSGLKEKDVLFIDEIHRLKPIVEEVLYSAMEDYTIDINLGQGSTAKSVRITLPQFTLIGATTRAGALTQPLISRFGIVNQFEFYQVKDLKQICKNNADYFSILIDQSGIEEISKRSRGTPRILNRILKRVRDFAQVSKKKIINKQVADYALKKMQIDENGLDNMDRRILSVIIKQFNGGPVGIENLSTAIGEDSRTIEDMYETYLIQIGLIKRTSKGRLATPKAFKYLKISYEKQPSLFNFNSSLSS